MDLALLLGAAASLVTIGGAVYGVARHLNRKNRPELATAGGPSVIERRAIDLTPHELEIVPMHFELSLSSNIPHVEVELRAITYLRKSLKLEDVLVTLYLGECAKLERLALVTRTELPVGRSRQIFCRRPLVEAEVKQIRSCFAGSGPLDQSVHISGNGRSGRKTASFETVHAQRLRGWITGLGSESKPLD